MFLWNYHLKINIFQLFNNNKWCIEFLLLLFKVIIKILYRFVYNFPIVVLRDFFISAYCCVGARKGYKNGSGDNSAYLVYVTWVKVVEIRFGRPWRFRIKPEENRGKATRSSCRRLWTENVYCACVRRMGFRLVCLLRSSRRYCGLSFLLR